MQRHEHQLLLEMCLKTFIANHNKTNLTEYDKNVPDVYRQYCNAIGTKSLNKTGGEPCYLFTSVLVPSLEIFSLDLRPDLEP